MGLKVLDEVPYLIEPSDAAKVWVDDFGVIRRDGKPISLTAVRELFEEAFARVWSGEMESDGFNRLVIEAGAELWMPAGTSIVTFRGLEAIGTQRRPISIRAADPARAWGSIGVARAPETSQIAFATVSGGSHDSYEGIRFTGALSFNASDVVVRDCDIRDAHGDNALSIKRALFHVVRSRFLDNRSDGLDAEWSTGSVDQSLFAHNGDDGLDLAGSEVRVRRAWFRRMGDKAISAGERSHVAVRDSQIADSQIAIASKEGSVVEVEGTEFRRNEVGVSLYRDKPIFGAGAGVVTGGLFAENLRDFAVENGSDLRLNGVERRAVETRDVLVGLREDTRSDRAIP